MKPVLILFFLFLSIILAATLMCDGVLCDSNCQNCYQCNPSTCNPSNNCQCASKNIPGNLNLADTPQFVFFTIDDFANQNVIQLINNFDWLLNNPNITDANGCPPKISAYVTSNNMDYNVVNWENRVGSVGLHTITHTTGAGSNLAVWQAELKNNYDSIKILGNVSSIPGSRAPYLEPNQAYFSVLKALGITYDSSYQYYPISWNSNPSQQASYWPFTLDYGLPESDLCDPTTCPTSPNPGIWEVPLVGFLSGGVEINPMNLDPSTFADFKTDFNSSFWKNRVPRGVYTHYAYLTVGLGSPNPTVVQFNKNIFEWISANYKNNILFATEIDVIQWMKNPQPITQTKAMSQFQCRDTSKLPSTTCNWQTCGFNAGYLKTCSPLCPLDFPNINGNWINPGTNNGIVSWVSSNPTVLISSDWGTGICGNIKITNPAGATQSAKSALITVGLCGASISSLWQYTSSAQISSSSTGVQMRILLNDANIAAGGINSVIGFCATRNTNYNIYLGIDLFSSNLGCPLGQCNVTCGDGVCSGDETAANCPYDCAPSVCTRSPSNNSSTNSSVSGPSPLLNTWPGIVTIGWGSDWGTGGGAGFYISNPGLITAASIVMTVSVCTTHFNISSMWGYATADFPVVARVKTYRIVGAVTVNTGSSVNPVNFVYIRDAVFDKTRDVRYGVDFYPTVITDAPATVEVLCGNGVCDAGETSTNCAIDCNPLVC